MGHDLKFKMAAMPIYGKNHSNDISYETTETIFSSPEHEEHEVLMVSYCDQSMSVVHRQQFVLKAISS